MAGIKIQNLKQRAMSREPRAKRGQALAELAIFGALLILVMGAMISYGLKYNFEQSAKMQAFRRAMRIAADPDRGSGSYVVHEEKHIPDPMDQYGIGSTTLVSGSGSVTRDSRLDAVIDNKGSLPVTVTDIALDQSGGVTTSWTTMAKYSAGFRIEKDVPTKKNIIKKYQLVYGSTTMVARAKDGVGWTKIDVSNDDAYSATNKRALMGCAEEETTINPTTGEPVTICKQRSYAEIRIMDMCSGQMVDASTCYNQGRMILDQKYCTDECIVSKMRGSDLNCKDVCKAVMYPLCTDPNGVGPWYLQGWRDTGARNKKQQIIYIFPNIDKIFQLNVNGTTKDLLSLGIQGYTTGDITSDETFTQTETASQVTTDEDVDRRQSTTRAVVYNENLDAEGVDQGHANPVETSVTTVVTTGGHETWQTEK